MNELIFLVYGIIFLLLSLYLIFSKNKWAIFTLVFGVALLVLYFFLPSTEKDDDESNKEESKKEESKGKFYRLQSPILRNTFNYIKDPQKDGSTGRLEYGGDRNMTRWNIPTKEYTHVKFPNGLLFKLRKPSSDDSYGYFVNENPQKNFFSDFIEIGTFSQ